MLPAMPDDTTSTAETAIRRLAAMSAGGASPDRMVRSTTETVLRWQREAGDETELRMWLEALWHYLSEGVLAQEAALSNLDRADKLSGPVIKRMLEGLRDSRAVVTAVLERV
jgi:hypothetical protein